MTEGVKVRIQTAEKFGRVLEERWFPRVPVRDEYIEVAGSVWIVRSTTWLADEEPVTAMVEVKAL